MFKTRNLHDSILMTRGGELMCLPLTFSALLRQATEDPKSHSCRVFGHGFLELEKVVFGDTEATGSSSRRVEFPGEVDASTAKACVGSLHLSHQGFGFG